MIQNSDVAEWASYITVGLFGVAYSLQKYIKGWRETGASSDVVKLLHTEVLRMSEQNSKLMIEIGHLQNQIVSLNQQLTDLQHENQLLNTQVRNLTAEVSRLHIILPSNTDS